MYLISHLYKNIQKYNRQRKSFKFFLFFDILIVGEIMKQVILKIGGMSCSACSTGLEKFLNKQEGIKNATVNLIMNNASIEYDDEKLNLENIEKFIGKAG